jgi:hypothetical protein
MARRIHALALFPLFACHSGVISGESSGALSYAQYQSLEKGMREATVLQAFGRAHGRVEKDGKVESLTYRCEDAEGNVKDLRLAFDAEGVLERWSFEGQGAP